MLRLTRTVVLLLILVVATVLRVRGIGHDSLWGDEALTIMLAKMPVVDLVKYLIWYEQIPPVHHLVVHYWMMVFGDSEASVRMPSALAGIAGVYVTYILVRRLMGERIALITALLLAVSPMHIEYSRECRSYSLAVLLGVISCHLFVRLLRRPTAGHHAWYVIVSALLLYTHLYGAFTLLAQQIVYVGSWWRRRRAGRAMQPALSSWVRDNIATAALFGPWIPVTLTWMRQVSVAFWVKKVTLDDITRAYWHFSGSVPVFLAMLALVAIGFWCWRRRLNRLALLISLMLVPVVVPVAISILTRPSFAPRYGIMACVGWCGMAAAGLAALRPLPLHLAALAGLTIVSPTGDAPKIVRQPWRDAASFLNQNMRQGDLAVVHGRYGGRLFNYYVRRSDVEMRGVDTPVIPVTLPMDGQRVWLVTSLDGLSPHHFLARAPWRIERRLWLGGILVLELTDEAGPDGPTIARPATAPMGTGASTLTHGTGPHIRDELARPRSNLALSCWLGR